MMSLKKDYAIKKRESLQCNIVNANYQKVLAVLCGNLQDERTSVCHCEKCISDITAIALNRLPPHYYVDPGRGGDIGSPFVMVESAVREAMEMVGENPRHQER